MAHVHCGVDQGLCFRMAGELCPGGYEMKPVLRDSDGNFLVRCRTSAAPPVAASCAPVNANATPSPSPVVATNRTGLMDPWPPAAEPAPATYPWPSTQTSAATRSPQNAPAAQGDVDLGY